MYYKKGTIKLVWIPSDYSKMESQMFSSVKKALEYAKKENKQDFMIMKLINSDNHFYRWKVLPYGTWNKYNYGMKIFKTPIFLIGIGGLAIFGAYKLLKHGLHN